MKLKYFAAIVVVIFGAGIFALFKACKDNEPPPKPKLVEPTPTPPAPRPEPMQDPPPTTPAAAGELAARPYDAEVLAWRTKSLSGDKGKDVSKGKSYKINVYKDAGHTTVNRAKVDINRNDKFDEKYTFEGEKITLQRAPADDEKYTETYHWTGSAWLPEGAASTKPAPAPPAPTPAAQPTPAKPTPAQPTPAAGKSDLAARPHDAEVIAWRDKTISSDKEKDVTKGKAYKVNVYKDAGSTNVNRAKVDLDRDDKFDEKYTFEASKITLQRAPADDEKYTETYHWTGSGWAKQ